MSLLDMMNFSYFSFATAVQLVTQDLASAIYATTADLPKPPSNEAVRAAIQNHFELLARKCGELLLERADARLQRISLMLRRHYTYAELAQELETILQAIEDDIKLEYFSITRDVKG